MFLSNINDGKTIHFRDSGECGKIVFSHPAAAYECDVNFIVGAGFCV